MSSSPWRNIPFCMDALLKMQPRRVLDVGVGSGRWGMIVRELSALREAAGNGRGDPLHIEGIEAVAELIGPHNEALYDRIHIGDAVEILPRLPDEWDVIILGNVLEHMPRAAALRLADEAVERATYVLINVLLGAVHPQPRGHVHPCERRVSTWETADFDRFPLVRKALFNDHEGRPFASFVISRGDPQEIRASLFAPGDYADLPRHERMSFELDQLLDAIGDTAAELQYIKAHSVYRAGQRLRSSGLWNLLRWLKNRNRRIVQIRNPLSANPASRGIEVWLVHASPDIGENPIPWDFLEYGDGWHQYQVSGRPYGHCLVSQQSGSLRVPGNRDPELRFMTHPFSGHVTVSYQGRTETIDLYSRESGEVRVFPARAPMVGEPERRVHEQTSGAVAPTSPRSPVDEAFLRSMAAAKTRVVAVHCPRWMGVTHSTRTLFEHTYPVPESPDEEPYKCDERRLDRYVDVLCESAVEHIVFSGGDELHFELMQRLRKRKPDVRCDLLWHGGYLFFNKDYDWRALRLWMDAARAGTVSVIGTVKKGMEEFFASAGLRSRLILNYVPGTPQESPALDGEDWHVGIWLSDTMWKVPHAMLAALKMVPGARLHAAGLSERAEEVARCFGVPVEVFHADRLPQALLHEEIRRTHLTLYITFTECCPMLPLESIQLGVPSLIGPSNHLFEDNQYLFERLVVPFPERAEVIARYARRALDERAAIMDECRRYIPEYNAAAQRSVAAFLAPV